MSTSKCYIGIENRDLTVSASYVWLDGYLRGVGRNLLNNWRGKKKTRAAIERGGARSWSRIIEEIDYMDDQPVMKLKDADAFMNCDADFIEFIYLLRNNGKWVYNERGFYCRDADGKLIDYRHWNALTHHQINREGPERSACGTMHSAYNFPKWKRNPEEVDWFGD